MDLPHQTRSDLARPAPASVLADVWQSTGLDLADLASAELSGGEPAVRSSFAVGTALQVSTAAAALAAARIGRERGGPAQWVRVAMADALCEATGFFRLDGHAPPIWEKYSGLYPCGQALGAPGHVRIHANFAHHRDGALRLLGLPGGELAEREQIVQALRHWRAEDFEAEAARAGLVVAAARRFAQWDAHPQSAAIAAQPLLAMERVGDAAPQPLPPLANAGQRPLHGLRVLDLTRILAGPVAGRTLAAYGADVMLVNGPHLPNIAAIADTSRGKRSVHIDLREAAGRQTLRQLVRQADVLVQGYRPGALAGFGLGAQALAELRPGLVCVSLSAYGETGPWAGRRGFDSLVQTATGFNWAEAEAFGVDAPQAMPVQVLDYSAGFLMAFAAQAALLRRAREGGSWHVGLTLARTALWLRAMGQRPEGVHAAPLPDPAPALETSDSGFGRLQAVRHAARFSHTPAGWDLPSMPPGAHPPQWPRR